MAKTEEGVTSGTPCSCCKVAGRNGNWLLRKLDCTTASNTRGVLNCLRPLILKATQIRLSFLASRQGVA